ncbi:hypothetical protein M1L60_31410 [Actinoplanes sp. TRM 88003]|uniref:Uncharacterized protein n=1 Tax=Paractinoplanes aksuensis TaxID=2939490 RepID=A0ABT1DW56_9ACTN|nr:hypothetical protein [Actinoplanes aksuensis]MCO8275097.1 hypothetical protein [Actinoplanes aksuensis]
MRLLRAFAVLSLAAGSVAVVAGPARAASCLDPGRPPSVEENRLTFTLPGQDRPFARQMIEGAGFQNFTPALVRRLCATRSLAAAERVVARDGERLWRAAVDRAQRHGPVRGELPYSDDRPLYWARVEAMAAIRQFPLFSGQNLQLIEKFDRASRGMSDINLPTGATKKRVIVSGFDPYTLDGGVGGNNIRHGNPSGATALSLDGTRHGNAFIETYTLPVSYPEFRRGYLEDTVGPLLPQLDASITVSQAGGAVFNLEQFNGRYHGVSLGNDNFRPCAAVGGVPQLAVNNPECNIVIPDRWGGPATPELRNPPQWTAATLPVEQMIAANTGADVPRPPGDTWPDESVAFGVVWRTSYTEFPDCAAPERVTRDGVPPSPQSCAYSGGGGNYLSNESAYRNTLLRDRLDLSIPAGHIHTPDMQHFETDYEPSDPTFDAWRLAIAQQTRNLIHVVADEA